MGKDTTSFYLSDETLAYLRQPGVNASGTIDQLVQNHIAGAGVDREILLLRKEQLEGRVEHYRQELDRCETELAAVEQRLESETGRVERTLAQASRMLSESVTESVNPAIENWAAKVDMPPEEFRDRLIEFRASEEDGEID